MRKRIILLVILGLFFLLVKLNISPVLSAGGEATFSLSPVSGTYKTGETFSLDVILNTAGAKIGGADIYLTFDQNKLSLLTIDNGTLFDQYVGRDINNGSGTAAISGLATADKLFLGTGTFATLKFKGLAAGTGEVKFKFTPGETRDTNAIDFDTLKDSLVSVVNGSYTITGVGGVESTAGPTKPVPVTASYMPTVIVILLGALLVLSGGLIVGILPK